MTVTMLLLHDVVGPKCSTVHMENLASQNLWPVAQAQLAAIFDLAAQHTMANSQVGSITVSCVEMRVHDLFTCTAF